jgi:hypothetical protein
MSAGRVFAVLASVVCCLGLLTTFVWAEVGAVRWLVIGVFLAVGALVNGVRLDSEEHPVTAALGRPVRVGIGSSALFLGAYLAGPALASLATSSNTREPSVVMLLLFVFGIPLLALVRLAWRGLRAGVVGIGLVVPILVVGVLTQAGVSVGVVGIVMVVVAVASLVAVLVLQRGSRWADGLAVLGGMAASVAVGAGAASFATLSTVPAGTPQRDVVPSESSPVMLAVGLGLAVVFVAVAALRRDTAGGVVAAAVFATVPGLTVDPERYAVGVPQPLLTVHIVVPVVVALFGLGLLQPSLRQVVVPSRWRTDDNVINAATCVAIIGVACVVLVVQVLPLLGMPLLATGLLTLGVLLLAGAVAWRLPGSPGAVMAATVLIGLALAAPWSRLAIGWSGDLTLFGVVGLGIDLAVAVVLILRHRRASVAAAAAYLGAGALAFALGAIFFRQQYGLFGEGFAELVVVGPLLVLGIPAGIVGLAVRRETVVAMAQAAGSVLLVAGGVVLLRQAMPRDLRAFDVTLAPWMPTDAFGAGRMLRDPEMFPVVCGAMLLLAVLLLLTTIRRASTPLVASGLLVLAASGFVGIVGVAETWDSSTVDALAWVLLIAGAALAFVAAITARASVERSARAG